jgi:hypothetical protein
LKYLEELQPYEDHVLCAPSMSKDEFQESYGVKGFTPAQLEQKIREGRNHDESRTMSQNLVKSLKISGSKYRKELIGVPEVPDYPFSYISRMSLQDSVPYASQLLGLEESEQQADLAKAAKRKNQRRRSRSSEREKRGRNGDDDDEEGADGKRPRLTITQSTTTTTMENLD